MIAMMVFYSEIPLDTYEYTFIRDKILYPDFVCLDIGANTGEYTKLMASNCKEVYAFEPDSSNFAALAEYVKDYHNCILYQNAVTKEYGKTTLYKSSVNNGMHRIYQTSWHNKMLGTEVVDCINIDGFVLPRLDRLDFVKIDVEGSEWGVLQGMARTLHKFRPTMIIEFHAPSLEEYQHGSAKEIYDFLIQYYGKIRLMATSYQQDSQDIHNISYDELMRITSIYDSRNILVI